MNEWFVGAMAWWNARTLLERGSIVLGVLLLVGWGAITATPRSINYVTLVRDLPLADIRRVQAVLETEGVPHRLADDGTRLEVSVGDYPRARVALADPTLQPGGGVGFELFQRNNWGMTEFTAKVQYRQALEGELSRSIGRLDDIASADVRLTVPDRNTLRTLRLPAQGAVVLKTRSGRRPSDETVAGIAQLVGRAVEGLEPNRVVVLDAGGRVLSLGDTLQRANALTGRQMDLQRAAETELANKILSLLVPVVGEGHVRAEVTALIDFDAVDRLDERVDPNSTVLLNERRAETPAEFAVDSLGERPGLIVDNTFGTSRTTERLVRAVGGLRRLTVAVLLDDTDLPDETARAELLGKAEGIVRAAVGFDESRGDEVTVAAVGFTSLRRDEAALGSEAEAEAAVLAQSRILWYVAGGLALLVGVWLAFRRGAKSDDKEEQLVLAEALAATPPSPAEPPAPPLPVDVLRTSALAIVTERPETAVQVLRGWITEGRF